MGAVFYVFMLTVMLLTGSKYEQFSNLVVMYAVGTPLLFLGCGSIMLAIAYMTSRGWLPFTDWKTWEEIATSKEAT